MTLLPWFEAPGLEPVEKVVQQIAAQQEPFAAQVGERTYFGARKLPVMKIDNMPQLQALHEALLGAVEQQGWPMQGRYTGQQFSPHVTQKAGRDVRGELQIDALHIAEALPQGYRRLVSQVALGAKNG